MKMRLIILLQISLKRCLCWWISIKRFCLDLWSSNQHINTLKSTNNYETPSPSE